MMRRNKIQLSSPTTSSSLFSFTQSRLMRFSSPPPPPPPTTSSTSSFDNNNHNNSNTSFHDITKPVKLRDDYVPFPLPKYDKETGEFEPLPFAKQTKNPVSKIEGDEDNTNNGDTPPPSAKTFEG